MLQKIPAAAAKLGNMFDALRAVAVDAQSEIAQIDQRIAELREQREPLERAALHVDDVAELAGKALDSQRHYFARRVAASINVGTVRHRGAEGLTQRHRELGVGLLHVTPNPSDTSTSLPLAAEATLRLPPDAQAIVGLLAPVIKAGLRPFLLEVCPELSEGMPLAERDAALAKIDAELVTLNERRAAILNALREAGTAVSGQ